MEVATLPTPDAYIPPAGREKKALPDAVIEYRLMHILIGHQERLT